MPSTISVQLATEAGHGINEGVSHSNSILKGESYVLA